MSFQAYIDKATAQTGKTPDDFRVLANAKGLTKHGEVLAWLKSEYGLGHGHATAVTHLVLHAGEPEASVDDKTAKHFAGNKARWLESYNELIDTVSAFGPDVSASPGGSYISLLRGEKKFGIVQVSGVRMDIGIKLKNTPAEGRFELAGAWNAMVTHRVQITDTAQIDAELTGWLRQAYEKA